MTRTINGLAFTLYSVRGQLKIAHCSRIAGRVGKAVVRNVASDAEAWAYAKDYAA